MKKRKLKKWVIPSLIIMCLMFLNIMENMYIFRLKAENRELNTKYNTLEINMTSTNTKLSEKITLLEDYFNKLAELKIENSKLKEEIDKYNEITINETELTSVQNIDEPEKTNGPTTTWTGNKLNKTIGTIQGPSGKETYYNLPMQGVINLMQNAGYSYEYWVRDDGVKMYGDYVMCACSFDIRPRGTVVETSLGMGICADTGTFAQTNQSQIDIAVDW